MLLKSVAALIALSMIIPITITDELHIPSSSWEQHSQEGVVVAMTFGNSIENGVKKSSLKIYIKNTSNTERDFYPNGHDSGVHISYINDQGSQISLHDYSPDLGPKLHKLRAISIQSEATLCVTIDLSPDEANLLASHPVKCSFSIYDPVAKKGYKIESSPKMLVSGT